MVTIKDRLNNSGLEPPSRREPTRWRASIHTAKSGLTKQPESLSDKKTIALLKRQYFYPEPSIIRL